MATEIFRDYEYQVDGNKPRLATDLAIIEGYLPLLANEFTHNTPDVFSEKLLNSLRVNGRAVFSDSSSNPRGADMFFLLDNEGVIVAISVSKYYAWDLLRKQLCLQPTVSESGEITHLRVRSFDDLSSTHFFEQIFSSSLLIV